MWFCSTETNTEVLQFEENITPHFKIPAIYKIIKIEIPPRKLKHLQKGIIKIKQNKKILPLREATKQLCLKSNTYKTFIR